MTDEANELTAEMLAKALHLFREWDRPTPPPAMLITRQLRAQAIQEGLLTYSGPDELSFLGWRIEVSNP